MWAERLASYLQQADSDQMMQTVKAGQSVKGAGSKVTQFSKQDPLAVVAGGLALGIVAPRLLKKLKS